MTPTAQFDLSFFWVLNAWSLSCVGILHYLFWFQSTDLEIVDVSR